MGIRADSAGKRQAFAWFSEARLTLYLAGVLLVYADLVVMAYFHHWWFISAEGKPAAADFVFLWAGGHLAMQGQAAAVYDWMAIKNAEIAILGHSFSGYFAWLHPPMLLLVVAPLSLLPYMPSWFLWDAVTALFFVWAISRIHRHRTSLLISLSAPASLWCASIGQDGFLTAGLIAATLAYLEDNPVLAGVFLGLLTYKPHFGVAFPFVLLLTGRWRAFASASVTTLVFAGVSLLVFGTDTWVAFLGSMAKTTDFLLIGGPRWTMLQSIYAYAHGLTGKDSIAWVAHVAVALGVIAIMIWAWRQPISYDVKAALLGTAALLVPPYVFAYDTVILAVPA